MTALMLHTDSLEIPPSGVKEQWRSTRHANSLHGSDFAPLQAPRAGVISRPPFWNFEAYSQGAA